MLGKTEHAVFVPMRTKTVYSTLSVSKWKKQYTTCDSGTQTMKVETCCGIASASSSDCGSKLAEGRDGWSSAEGGGVALKMRCMACVSL